MLCSERELELSDEHEGIIELDPEAASKVGESYAQWAGLGDPVVDVAVTPNRQDCMGVRGIARDLAAAGLGLLAPAGDALAAPGARLQAPSPQQVARIPRLRANRTDIVRFATAPFPYDGDVPGSDKPFLDVEKDGRRGHTTPFGRLYWADETYSDDRVLLHIPKGFDASKPSVMVVFFHGHGATLTRDVLRRQRVPQQVTASGANAVLVAPQLAFNASDSSAGKFWEPGAFARFIDEAAYKLALIHI